MGVKRRIYKSSVVAVTWNDRGSGRVGLGDVSKGVVRLILLVARRRWLSVQLLEEYRLKVVLGKTYRLLALTCLVRL